MKVQEKVEILEEMGGEGASEREHRIIYLLRMNPEQGEPFRQLLACRAQQLEVRAMLLETV